MPTIVINKDTLRGGLKPSISGLSNSEEAAFNEYIRSNGIDFNRDGFEGHITPAQLFDQAGVTNAGIDSLPRSVVVDTTYLVGNARIYYITAGRAGVAPKLIKTTSPSTYVSSTYITVHPGGNFTALPATGYWGEDIITYKIGATPATSTTYLFYSYNDSLHGDVGIASTDLSAQNDYYLFGVSGTTYLTVNVPHRMAEGADGKLYITNGQYVSQFDGVTNTVNYSAYDLGFGWVATDVRRFGNFLAISSVRTGGLTFFNFLYYVHSQVTLWNMTETNLGLVYPVADNYISAIYTTPENRLFVFSAGRNNTMKLFEFTGQGFKKLWESLVYATPPDPRGIEIYKDLLTWISGGYCLTFDLKNGGVNVSYYMNVTTGSGFAPGGFLKNTDQAFLLASGNPTSAYGSCILNWATSGYATIPPDLWTRLFRLPYKSTIKKVRIWVSQIASGGSAQFSIFKNYTNSSVGTAGTDLFNKTISFTTNGAIAEYEWNVSIPNVSSFYMNVRVVGQISIAQIQIDWVPRDKN